MAANFNEMVANRAASATRARLANFYRSQGYDESTAVALAVAEMGRRAPPDYSIPDPGYEGPTSAPLVEALREHAQANPRELAATRSSTEDLPGFDPTAREYNAQQAAEAAARMQQQASTLHQQMYGRSPAMSDEDVARAESMATAGREPPRSSFDLSPRRTAPQPAPTYPTETFRTPERPSLVERAMEVVERPVSSATRMAENVVREDQGAAPPAAATATAPAATVPPSASARQFPYIDEGRSAYDAVLGAAPASVPSRAAPVVRREQTPPTPMRSPVEREAPSFLSRLFSGPAYQSTGDLVVKEGGQGVNWGSPESAADFVRADKALRAQRPEMFERQAEARGGAPKSIGGNGGGGKDAALHKALEIIHHLLSRGH